MERRSCEGKARLFFPRLCVSFVFQAFSFQASSFEASASPQARPSKLRRAPRAAVMNGFRCQS
jgi:hypothetical protein